MLLETNKLKTLLPYITSVIIICGYFKLSIYYNHFNIRISDYVEIIEILTIFISDVLKYSVLIFGIYLFSFIVDSRDEINDTNDKSYDILETENARQRFKKFLKLKMAALMLLILIIILSILAYSCNSPFFGEVLIWVFVIFALLFFQYILFEFQRKYKIVYEQYFNLTYFNLLIAFSLFFVYVIQSAYSDIKTTEEKNPTVICFKYLDNLIQSDDDNVFVGQTKNYLFLYNKLEKETAVFSRNEIKDLKIRRKQ